MKGGFFFDEVFGLVCFVVDLQRKCFVPSSKSVVVFTTPFGRSFFALLLDSVNYCIFLREGLEWRGSEWKERGLKKTFIFF